MCASRLRSHRCLTPTLYAHLDCSGKVPTPRLVDEVSGVVHASGPQTVQQLGIPAHLESIEHVSQVDFDALPAFVKSSCDPSLVDYAQRHKCRLACSTSSMTSALANVFFAVSGHRRVSVSYLSSAFQCMNNSLTQSARSPASILLRREADTLWMMDNDSSPSPTASRVLMDLGKSLEHKLTLDHPDYMRLVLKRMIAVPESPSNTGELAARGQQFAFTKIGTFMIRSQLDCSDSNLPLPNQTFDLKTRAVLPIRHNLETYEQHLSYDLSALKGEFNSFERELYDLSRSVMLKYSFQVRLGRMHGVFVAYHNTDRFFGFEYLSLRRMDEILIGNSKMADRLFDISIKLLERILCEITSDFSDESALKITFRAPPTKLGHLQVFVELNPPVIDDISLDELKHRLLSEFSIQLPEHTSQGALKTRYEECLRQSTNMKSYKIAALYEKAAGGKLFMYTMDVRHILNGKPLDNRWSNLSLKSARSNLETQFRLQVELVSGPLSIAREYWYMLKENEYDRPSSPRLFMYK